MSTEQSDAEADDESTGDVPQKLRPSGRTMGTETRKSTEHARSESSKRARKRRRALVKAAIDRAEDEMLADNHAIAGVILRDRLIPALDVFEIRIDVATDILKEADDRTLLAKWHPEALREFLNNADTVIETVGTARDFDRLQHLAAGLLDPDASARKIIEQATDSLEVLAILEGVIEPDLDRSSVLYGRRLPVGLWWTSWEMHVPPDIDVDDTSEAVPFHLSIGDTGSGKSVSIARLVQDRYADGYKILDIHDRSKLESAIYDIDQQDASLRRILDDMGLPTTIDGHPHLEQPELEIYVPLTSNLDETQVLYEEAGEDSPDGLGACKVTPFTVAPSDLPTPIFVSFLAGGLTNKEENVLRSTLAGMGGDWSLADLADEVMGREVGEGIKEAVIARIKELQDEGWLRDRECPYRLDGREWASIFRDTDTITLFSTSLVESDITDFRVFLYLLKTVYSERRRVGERFPNAAVVMRELHHVCPSQRKRREDSEAKRLQKQTSQELQDIAAEHRHADMEILGDSQHWLQLYAGLREHADRVFIFSLSEKGAKKCVDEILGRGRMDHVTSAVPDHEAGECTIVAKSGRIHAGGRDWQYAHPVATAPPSCHVIDTKLEGSGWTVRANHLEETLADPPEEWPIELPDRLRFSDEVDQTAPRDEFPGVWAFATECIRHDEGGREAKNDVLAVYEQYAETHGHETDLSKQQFIQRLRAVVPYEIIAGSRRQTSKADGRRSAYGEVAFTDHGRELLEAARESGSP